MADREPFPYGEEWRTDLPMLFKLGVVQALAEHIVSQWPRNSQVYEGLHCQTVWSEWDWHREGQRHLRIRYKYPSNLYGENEVGSLAADGEVFGLDEDRLRELEQLADNRPIETWKTTESNC
ncbi:MAG: hypothetical protein JWS12_485 [Candidatus Saccharibacteria bacterium]|nr:hypothetical protein [Candidatus Saccharibacteria bacterium]